MSFINKIFVCAICSILIGLAYFLYTKYTLQNDDIEVIIELNAEVEDKNRNLELYVDKNEGYLKCDNSTMEYKPNGIKASFQLGQLNENIKKIRLDFENFKSTDKVFIEEIRVINKAGNSLSTLKNKNVVDHLYLYSKNISVQNGNITLVPSESSFDPYIVFNASSFFFYTNTLMVLMLLPWLLFFGKSVYSWIRKQIKDRNFETVLITLFFLVLPLKIAWITFITLLLLLYSIIKFFSMSKATLKINTQGILFFFLFVIYLLFGRIETLNDLHIQFAFILVPLIFVFNIPEIKILNIYSLYSRIFLVLMALIIVFGVLFVSQFKSFFEMEWFQYFLPENTKMFNKKMMWWLPYAHPTFLPSFCLIGMIFTAELFRHKVIQKKELIIYGFLCFLCVILFGSRIMLVAWGIYVVAFAYFHTTLSRTAYLLITTTVIILFLFFFICDIDQNRCKLWQTSYSAIAENIYGYGINTSSELLSNVEFLSINGYSSPPRENHSHNQFLTVFMELGIFALLFFIAIIKYLGYYLSRNLMKPILMTFFLFLLLLVTESPFKTATPTYFFTFIYCLSCLGNTESKGNSNSTI